MVLIVLALAYALPTERSRVNDTTPLGLTFLQPHIRPDEPGTNIQTYIPFLGRQWLEVNYFKLPNLLTMHTQLPQGEPNGTFIPLGTRQELAPAPQWAMKTLHFFTELGLLEVQQTATLLASIQGQLVPTVLPTSLGNKSLLSYPLSNPPCERTSRASLGRTLSQHSPPFSLALHIALFLPLELPKQALHTNSPFDLGSTPHVLRNPLPLIIKSLTK